MASRIVVCLALFSVGAILASSNADSVLGRWSDGKEALTFRRDGTVVKRPLGKPGQAGTPATLKYRVEGDRVVITDAAGNEFSYRVRRELLLGPSGKEFKRWNIVVTVFQFTMAPDGSRGDIKFVMSRDPMDLHIEEGALTEKEKRAGIHLMAQRKAPISLQEVGKTRYDYILFDGRTRSYVQ